MAETLTFTYTYGSTLSASSNSTATTTAAVAAGEVITSSLVLPSQTVPFAQPDSCTTAPTVVCDNLDAGVTCTGVASAEGGKTTTIDDNCFPEGYQDVFFDGDGVYRDIRALAYPGTACPTSWTVACSTSLPDLPTSSFPLSIASQSWCCPPGWGCQTSGPRLCQSFAQTKTSVLLSGSATDFSVFMVHTEVFPLQADLSSTPTTSSFPPQVGGTGGLNAGAIVGIVFGVIIFVSLLAIAWYLWRYVKRKREGGGVVELEMNGLDRNGKRYRDNVAPGGDGEAVPSSSGTSGPGTGTGTGTGTAESGSGGGGVKMAGDAATRHV